MSTENLRFLLKSQEVILLPGSPCALAARHRGPGPSRCNLKTLKRPKQDEYMSMCRTKNIPNNENKRRTENSDMTQSRNYFKIVILYCMNLVSKSSLDNKMPE